MRNHARKTAGLHKSAGNVTIRGSRLLMLLREAIMDASSIRTKAPHGFKMPPLIAVLLGAAVCGLPLLAQAQKNPLRDVFFGETHVHTSWSFDAYVFGNTLTGPEDAYQFAMGKPIRHPAGYMVQIKRPLDFEAVTDHSEYMGTIRLANDPQSRLEQAADRREAEGQKQGGHAEGLPLPRHVASSSRADQGAGRSRRGRHRVEAESSQIADKYNQPGKFTTFAAYEWTLDARTIATCTATSSSRTRRRFRRCRSPPSTRTIRRTCGTGWTASARRATSCWRSRTTRISPTASCFRWRSTARAGPSMPRGRNRG